jgi:hypothetical protein
MSAYATCAIETAKIAAYKTDLPHRGLHLFLKRFMLHFEKVRQYVAIDSADETMPIAKRINLG